MEPLISTTRRSLMATSALYRGMPVPSTTVPPLIATNGEGCFLTTEMMRLFFGHYLRSPPDAEDPRVSPLRATDLSGLPPALVITAGYDPLRDKGQQYAARLTGAGVPARNLHYEDMIHPFFSMSALFEQARHARREAARHLRAVAATRGREGEDRESETHAFFLSEVAGELQAAVLVQPAHHGQLVVHHLLQRNVRTGFQNRDLIALFGQAVSNDGSAGTRPDHADPLAAPRHGTAPPGAGGGAVRGGRLG